MVITAEVAHSTPLPTVLFLEIASLEARDIFSLPSFSDRLKMHVVTPFSIRGNRNASAITDIIRQIAAVTNPPGIKNVISAIPAMIYPVIIPCLLNLYSVSLLSKMISLMDILSARRTAFNGIRHSIAMAIMTVPTTRAIDIDGISISMVDSVAVDTSNRTAIIGPLIPK